MKTLLVILTASMAWLATAEASAQWPVATYSCRDWEFEMNASIKDRPSSAGNFALIRDEVLNTVLFTGEDATDLETAPGFDIRYLNRNSYGWEWEFEMSYNEWEILADINSTNGLVSPFFDPITALIVNNLGPQASNIQFSDFDYDYRSDIVSFEFNARRALRPGLTLLAGPRFIHLEEELDVEIDGSFDFLGATPLFTQTLEVEADNPLFGFQAGTDLFVPLSRTVYVTSFFKVGAYGNTAKNIIVQTNTLEPGTVLATRNRRSQGSFVGELGAKINMDVVPGMLSLFLGYEATWYDNVALAPNQLLGPGQFQVQMVGTPVSHGILIGGTLRR